jgi:2-amino-4-hydroxy-6-hydroxymethyldihydropteridine diphosphokinase
MPRAGIALGSNLGDSTGLIRQALTLLRGIATPNEPVLEAPVYRTAPVDCPPESPDFLNTVVEISFAGDAMELLAHTQAIERQLGRAAGRCRNAPRLIDVDLLYFGNHQIMTGQLTLPHPRLRVRRFVLQPLADIRPDLRLPGDVLDIAGHLAALAAAEGSGGAVAPA